MYRPVEKSVYIFIFKIKNKFEIFKTKHNKNIKDSWRNKKLKNKKDICSF